MNLYAHQQEIVDQDPKWAGLFLGTGAGKTRIALRLARGETLVICPKTQKQDGNWEREFRESFSEMQISRLQVVSKEEFRKDHAKLGRFDTVIIDEAHTCLGVTPNTRYRNKVQIPKTSQLFEALELYIAMTKPKRLYLCTATIGKSPMTIWGAARILGRDWDFFKFRNTFYYELPVPGRPIWVVKQDPELKERLAKAVHGLGYVGRLQDWFDVPDQTYKVDYLELTPSQEKAIKEAKLDFPDPIVFLGKQHQIENGVLTGDEYTPASTFKNAKIEKIKEYAYEFPKLIIFARYTRQIAEIKSALESESYYVQTLTGQTKDKGEVLNDLKKRDAYVLIAQCSISAGWELPECNTIIFASMEYSYVHREQGEGRVLRSNAIKKNLYIDLIVKGGTDEAVYKSIAQKKSFVERIYAEQL